MTTDPGDLVLDPTCGSGTTAFVAEKWGRRWITCDTSRVAVTLAKQRLMTASYDYYELKYPHEGLKGGFIYKTVPHVTLKSIANNPEIDEIYERHAPGDRGGARDAERRAEGNVHPPMPFAVTEGGRKGETAVELRREARRTARMGSAVRLSRATGPRPRARPSTPSTPRARRCRSRWTRRSPRTPSRKCSTTSRRCRKTKLRITGPFTVEAVPFPSVLALDEAEQPQEADVAIARSGESSRQHQWRDELLKTGIRGKGGQMLQVRRTRDPARHRATCTRAGTLADPASAWS